METRLLELHNFVLRRPNIAPRSYLGQILETFFLLARSINRTSSQVTGSIIFTSGKEPIPVSSISSLFSSYCFNTVENKLSFEKDFV